MSHDKPALADDDSFFHDEELHEDDDDDVDEDEDDDEDEDLCERG